MKLYRTLTCMAAMAVLGAACKEKEIAVYRVAREAAPLVPHGAHDGHESHGPQTAHDLNDPHAGMDGPVSMAASMPAAAEPVVASEAPPHWEIQPRTAMREASFRVNGEDGAVADVSLIILRGVAGKELDNVNRWLRQLGQEPITAEGLSEISQRFTTPLGEVTVVDLEGLPEGAEAAKDGRILAAMASREGGTWFFKMHGNAPLVAGEKEHFVEWVRSTRPVPAVASPAAAPEHAGDSAQNQGNVPANSKHEEICADCG